MNNNPTPAPEVLIDSHVHLDFPHFDEDREQVLQRARQAGVAAFVLPGVRADNWMRIRAVASSAADIVACYGLHPCFCDDHQPQHIEQLGAWIRREQPVAVGECGLDFHPTFADSEPEQRLYFEAQLVIARELELPVVLHARRSVDAVLKCLRQAGVHRGVMHSFSGSVQQAKAAVDQGMLIGLGGTLTHQRAHKLRGVAAALPLDALVLETDAPDQPGAAHRGMRNEPSYITSVLDVLQDLRPESRQQLAAATTANASALFSLAL